MRDLYLGEKMKTTTNGKRIDPVLEHNRFYMDLLAGRQKQLKDFWGDEN